MGERKVLILENGVQVPRYNFFARVLIKKGASMFGEPRASDMRTILDMEVDYKRGKLGGHVVNQNDPSLVDQTFEDIRPILNEYRHTRSLR